MGKADRTLVIIGRKEDRSADKIIRREVANRVGSGKLVVSTALSIYDVGIHVLSQGDRFDLVTRRPDQLTGRAAEKLPEKQPDEQLASR